MTRSFRLHRIALAAATALSTAPALAVDYQWNGGAFVPGTTAPNPMNAPDTLTIGGGSSKSINNTSWTNNGTVNWLTDAINGASAGITNNGLWTAQSNLNTFVWTAGNRPTFTQTGEFRVSSAALQVSMGSWAFVSDGGIFNAQAGFIDFNGGVATFNAGTSFIGGGAVRTTSDATFAGAFRSDNLRFSGGTVTGTNAVLQGGTATVGIVSWDTGSMAGQWTVSAGTTLIGATGGTKTLSNVTLLNQGTVAWTTSNALNGVSATINNAGLFDATATTQMAWTAGNRPSLVNTGTVRASNGATLTNQGFDIVSHGGTFDARAGSSIVFGSGVQRFNAGTVFSGAGSNVATSNATYVGTYTSTNLVLSSGTQTGGDGTVGSKAVAQGATAWTGGTLSGNWDLGAGHVLTAGAGGSKQLLNGSVTNLGTVTWATTETLLGGSATLTNLGLFQATSSASLLWNVGNRPTFVNAASGTVSAAAGVTLTNNSFTFINDGGTLLAAAGGSIVFNGTENRFNNGTVFSGAGEHIVAGTARFVDAYTASNNLLLQSGTFVGGDGTLGSTGVAQGSTRWTGGQFNGAWTWSAGHVLNAGTGISKQLLNTAITNAGSLMWGSTDSLLGGTTTLTNLGLIEAQESMSMVWNVGNRPLLANEVGATLRAAAGKTLTNTSFDLVNNGGMLVAGAGGAIVYDGGSNRFNDGTSFLGEGGLNVVNSNARFVDHYQSANLLLQAGTATGGDGVTAGSKAIAHGSTAWTGSTMNGTWELGADHTLTARGSGTKQILNASVTNQGVVDWQDSGVLAIGSSTLTNNGSIVATGDAQLVWNVGSQGVVVNNGLIAKTAGSGETALSSIVLTNNGTIAVNSGSIRLPNNWSNAGTLRGTGTFVTNALTSAGHVQPGASVGTLTIAGNYAQTAAGFFDVEVSGLASHDLLEVTGSVALNGTVAVICAGNCVFAVGDEIEVLDYTGTRTGTFAATTLAGFASGNFMPIYDDTNTRVLLRVLEVTTPVPEPGTWALWLAGLAGMTATQARRRRLAAQSSARPARAGPRRPALQDVA